VTYPSLYEGFGNAFLEAVYFKVPIVVNRYSIFIRDIEPRGFLLPAIDGFVTRRAADNVRRVIDDSEYRQRMVDHNYALARRFYGYGVLRRGLQALMAGLKGV
jgi:glycosyltransferase involved in cell wall biosynthesis